MDETATALRVYVGAFVDELARAGVTDVCICPGSRSTPLTLLVREHPGLKVWTHLDERSASFFALGMAKASGRAVAVLCTSGTAAANFMPAVAEAHNGRVPLIVLTADRPQELRDVGALQTIDQVRMYGSHAKWATEMLLPEATEAAARHARYAADRAVATALSSPLGPVHLNFPFREPLVPAAPRELNAVKPNSTILETELARPRMYTRIPVIEDIAHRIRGMAKGLVVCGPQDDDPDFDTYASRLAVELGCPLLADVLSQTRTGLRREAGAGEPNLIDRFDAFLRHPATVDSLAPDFIIRTGATPVSKPLQQYLDRYRDRPQIVFAQPQSWPDQGLSAAQVLWGGESWAEVAALEAFVHHAGPLDATQAVGWNESWQRVNEAAGLAVELAVGASDRMTEPRVFRRLADLVPEGAIVFAGNSMPVRDLDSFWPASTKRVRFMANRGASGIDGVVSTALGAAAASSGQPLVLVIGDISLYHDMNGLLAAKRHKLNATIIVLNNDGGGIFSFLPQAEQGEHFEELFGTPHGLDFRHTAALYGLEYRLTPTRDEFDEAVMHSLKSEGVSLIEVRTDRNENLALHRKIWADVAAALDKVAL